MIGHGDGYTIHRATLVVQWVTVCRCARVCPVATQAGQRQGVAERESPAVAGGHAAGRHGGNLARLENRPRFGFLRRICAHVYRPRIGLFSIVLA